MLYFTLLLSFFFQTDSLDISITDTTDNIFVMSSYDEEEIIISNQNTLDSLFSLCYRQGKESNHILQTREQQNKDDNSDRIQGYLAQNFLDEKTCERSMIDVENPYQEMITLRNYWQFHVVDLAKRNYKFGANTLLPLQFSASKDTIFSVVHTTVNVFSTSKNGNDSLVKRIPEQYRFANFKNGNTWKSFLVGKQRRITNLKGYIKSTHENPLQLVTWEWTKSKETMKKELQRLRAGKQIDSTIFENKPSDFKEIYNGGDTVFLKAQQEIIITTKKKAEKKVLQNATAELWAKVHQGDKEERIIDSKLILKNDSVGFMYWIVPDTLTKNQSYSIHLFNEQNNSIHLKTPSFKVSDTSVVITTLPPKIENVQAAFFPRNLKNQNDSTSTLLVYWESQSIKDVEIDLYTKGGKFITSLASYNVVNVGEYKCKIKDGLYQKNCVVRVTATNPRSLYDESSSLTVGIPPNKVKKANQRNEKAKKQNNMRNGKTKKRFFLVRWLFG
ncbi:hypothetical protein [Bernardetia sp.]|uniref:hypothetical protein n=1 Tax=Bernardetia sp. TaxID=1937974 RepID=UPI0025C32145|nr:hypothetical protein [Bernardetia sp.]